MTSRDVDVAYLMLDAGGLRTDDFHSMRSGSVWSFGRAIEGLRACVGYLVSILGTWAFPDFNYSI